MFGAPSKFHDEDYDGIVLHIPAWFIKMNNLQDAIDEFKSKLKDCKLSSFHPDHTSNLHELSEYESKSATVAEAKNKAKQAAERRAKIQELCLEGKMHPLSWVKEIVYANIYDGYLILNNGKQWDDGDIFTKHGVSAAFVKEFKSSIENVADLKLFAKNNNYFTTELVDLLNGLTDDTVMISTLSLGQSKQGWNSLCISFDVLTASYDYKIARKNILCRSGKVITGDDGVYGIATILTTHQHLSRIEGFVKNNMHLVPGNFDFNTLTFKNE